jgi:tetratricopeptide (TPR) repeat protein
MSLLNRVLASLGIRQSTGDVAIEADRVVLRDLQRAKAFPQEPKQFGHNEIAACEQCSKPLRKVVFTTAGSGDQVEIWRQYPLAVDGWMCPACGWSAMPRHISAEESVEYGRHGSDHASNGQFDDAEFWFRRIVGSWPGYAAGYADLGQLSCARADAAVSPDEKRRWRAEAETWFRRAVDADPDRRLAGVRIPFARVLALLGNEREALEGLSALVTDPATPDPIRTEAELLAKDLRDGRALFSRATEMVRGIVLEPPTKSLEASGRSALEEARVLLRQAAERKNSFATSWFLGKVELRLGNGAAAVAALENAHRIEPDQPNGCRELVAAYLELDRAHDGLPIARRATELQPDDAGLRCNLALVLLLTGDVPSARAEASAALSRDPNDNITRGLLEMIDDVIAGRRPRPRSLAEAEGRSRPRS